MKKHTRSSIGGFPKFRSGFIALGLLSAGACAPETAEEALETEQLVTRTTGQFLRTEDPVPGQYIVVLEDGDGSRAAENLPEKARALEARHGIRAEKTYQHALRGFVVRTSEERARALSEDPDVKYVVEDGYVRTTATQSGATWGLDRIDQRERPLSSSYSYNTTASNVHAYVIDTGIRATHSEFGGRASLDFSSISDGNGASDCNGHGTHVAGTIGGATYGVAKGVRLHSVRVLDCGGSGTTSGVISGVDWVTANHIKPAVANMSLGGNANQALDDAVAASISAGVVYAVAAGNNNADACGYSPARAANALTVGATDSGDARASYSNYGSCLDLFAPGSSITSAYKNSDTSTASMSGTSMASPHVAGTAALYLAFNPSWSPSELRTALLNATDGLVSNLGTGSPNRLLYSGWAVQNARVVSIRTPTNHYFITENGGGGDVDAHATAIGPWERYNLIDVNGGTLESGDTVHLQVLDGQYFAAEGGGGSYVKATVTAIGSWETFRIWKVGGTGTTITSGSTFALQASSGHYVVAEGGGGGEVNANRTAIGPWETLTLVY